MIVLVPVVIVACAAGALAAVAAGAWPHLDPSAPRIEGATLAPATGVQRHPRISALLRRRVDPGALTGLALTAAVLLLVAGAASTGLLLVMARHDAGLARFDVRFAQWGGDHATRSSTAVLKGLSQAGGTLGVIVVSVIVASTQRRRPNRLAATCFLTLVVAGQFAAVALIKGAVGRDRPAIDQLTGFSGSSFPSGHAAAAAAVYAAAALVLGRHRSRRTKHALTAMAAGIAAGVACTRVLLGVHWFTDVVAGVAVGWAWFALCSIAFGGRLLSFGVTVTAAEAHSQPPMRSAASGTSTAG